MEKIGGFKLTPPHVRYDWMSRFYDPILGVDWGCPSIQTWRIIPVRTRGYVTMVIVSPLRIGLWDPFQMAFSWLTNGVYQPPTNWDDPPSRLSGWVNRDRKVGVNISPGKNGDVYPSYLSLRIQGFP